MNIKKYLYMGIGVFLLIVFLTVCITAEFKLSHITSDIYAFIEKFFSQWSLALSAAGTVILALSVFFFIYESRRREDREKQQAIHALHDGIHWNLRPVIMLRFNISEMLRYIEEHHTTPSGPLPFELLDTRVFDDMRSRGQLYLLEDIRMDVVFCYTLIRKYNMDRDYKSNHLELLTELHKRLDKVIRDLEAKFKFLPCYMKDKGESEQTEQVEDKTNEAKEGLLQRKPWIPLLPFAALVVVTVCILLSIAFISPLDSEYTLQIRWSYVSHGLAGTVALLAALFSAQRRRWFIIVLIFAIEFYLLGMIAQLYSII